MSDYPVNNELIMFWHAWAPALASLLLVLVLLYAVMQFVVAGRGGAAARFLNGGSLRRGMIVGTVLAGTIPAAALGLILSERSATQREDRIAGLLEETTMSIARVVDSFIDKHQSGITTAASSLSAAGRFDRDSLTEALLRYHDSYDDFLTMLSANSQGDIVAATSNMTGFLAPVDMLQGHNVGDRPYFRQPMQDGRPFISKVFRGRDLGSDPIVAISAPLRRGDGAVVGIVEGSLNLSAFSRVDSYRPQLDGAVMILVDQDSRVIYSTPSAGLAGLQSIAADPLIGEAQAITQGMSYPFTDSGAGVDHAFIGAFAPTELGWRVYMRVPVDQISQQILADYSLGALLLVAACVFSLLLAGAVTRRVTRSVNDMNKAIASFSVDGSGEQIRTPPNTPLEFVPIFTQMRRRSNHLKKAYTRLSNSIEAGENLRRELTQVVALKETEIAERTADLEEANSHLSNLTRTDALTGLANRREFDTFEQRMWRHGARDGNPVSVILLDIDYFKIYNDSLGHQAGDQCLQQVATAIKHCATRPLDLVARYGGEEFVVVLGDATVADALVVADRMRVAVASLAIPHPGSSHDVVTVSVGAASRIAVPDGDSEAVIKAADEALYYAKAAGRNCVVFRKDDEFVTYTPELYDTSTTNVIAILSGSPPTRHRR